ncbi:MAG: hypothetical protein M3N11_00195 [Actinomycetota bacterium]|nr:hypothetical protein [Actinomycetota bacterium]
MPELENDLRTRLREDAERVRPDVDAAWSRVSRRLGAAPPGPGPTPAWPRQWWVASVAAALVAVLAAAVLVPGGRPTTVAGGPESVEQAGEAPDGAAQMRTDAPEAGGPEPRTAPAQSAVEAPGDRDGYVGPFEGVFPATSWAEYERLADEVAAGDRAWAADAEQVAARFLRERHGADPDGRLRPLDDAEAEYEWSGGRVVLRRYGPVGSPWVVTASEAAGDGVDPVTSPGG